MKPPYTSISSKHLWLSVGWFRGEPFTLFCFIIGQALGDPVDSVAILNFQIAHFMFAFGWKNY